MFIQCATPKCRTFKAFKKLDAIAMAWLVQNKERVINMQVRQYAGREYVFVNHWVS